MSLFTYKGKDYLFDNIESVLVGYQELFKEIKQFDLERDAKNITYHIKDPYTIIVLGEVKSGKSSFINALISPLDPVCKTGRKPTTDIVQKFKYGKTRTSKLVNQTYKETEIPNEFLQHVTVIDTPGINVIEEGHQEVTEGVLSAADLIFLIFPAQNAYSRTTWELHKEVERKWNPEGIVILQMKDLIPDEELPNITEYLTERMEKDLEKPLKIFPVSAKLEIEKAKGKAPPESTGFDELKDYIKNHAQERAYITKIDRLLGHSSYLSDSASGFIEKQKTAIEENELFRSNVQREIDSGKKKYNKQVDSIIQTVLVAYDKVAGEGRLEIVNGISTYHLSARSSWHAFAGGISNEEWVKNALEKVETDILAECTPLLETQTPFLADQIENTVHRVHMEIRVRDKIMEGHENPDFGGIKAIQEMSKNYTNLSEKIAPAIDAFKHGGIHFGDSGDAAAGLGLGVGGVVMAVALHNVALVAGPLLLPPLLYKKKIDLLREVDKALGKAREGIEANLKDKFIESFTKVEGFMNDVFKDFDTNSVDKQKWMNEIITKQTDLQNSLDRISKEAAKKKARLGIQ